MTNAHNLYDDAEDCGPAIEIADLIVAKSRRGPTGSMKMNQSAAVSEQQDARREYVETN